MMEMKARMTRELLLARDTIPQNHQNMFSVEKKRKQEKLTLVH
jgi:hypothetical protein